MSCILSYALLTGQHVCPGTQFIFHVYVSGTKCLYVLILINDRPWLFTFGSPSRPSNPSPFSNFKYSSLYKLGEW